MVVILNSYMDKTTDSHDTQLSVACLLLSVAEADEILEKQEIDTIQDILEDFFSIAENDALKLLVEAQDIMKNATGLFEFGQHLNTMITGFYGYLVFLLLLL